jgi:pimeloyl-ACP methyl ester carboxylesterase
MPSVGRLRYIEATPSGSEKRGVLVLLHGFPLNARMWEPQLSMSTYGWRVIAPHLRGFDDAAGRDPATSSIDDYAGDVIDLLDALKIEDAVIGGLSMGGYVAFALYRHAPQYFRGLVLADTRSEPDTPEGVEARKKMRALAVEKGAAAIAAEMMPKLLGETTRRERPQVEARVRELILSNSTTGIVGGVTALMTRPDSTPLLRSIHFPTLILVGAEDSITPPAMAEAMARQIGGAELVTIPQAGHMSNLEAPDAFSAALARFLTHRI